MSINSTLLGQMIAFALFVMFCMKYVWPPIITAMRAREKKIADGLAAAERGMHQQEIAEKHAAEELHKAKSQASEIIGKAEKRSAEIVDEARQTAKQEGVRIVQSAHADIEKEVSQIKDKLRTQVSQLALDGAGKILGREVNSEAHSKMLDELSQKL